MELKLPLKLTSFSFVECRENVVLISFEMNKKNDFFLIVGLLFFLMGLFVVWWGVVCLIAGNCGHKCYMLFN